MSHTAGHRKRSISHLYARLVTGRFRYAVILVWIVITVLAVQYLPPLSEVEGSDFGSLAPGDAPALRVERRAAEAFGFPLLTRTALIQHNAGGLPRRVMLDVFERAQALRSSGPWRPEGMYGILPITNTTGLFTEPGAIGTTAISYLLFDPRIGIREQVSGARDFAEKYVDVPGQHFLGATGIFPAWVAQGDAVADRIPIIEAATAALILTIIGLTFRSLLAPVVTLAAGLMAYVIGERFVAWVGSLVGIALPVELRPLMVVLLLGIVTDYSIFFLAGQRHQLAQGRTGVESAREAAATYGPVILTAGLIVTVGTMGLLIATLAYYRAFGPGMALTVFVGLVVAMTLVPALLATLGRALYWPGGVQTRAIAGGGGGASTPISLGSLVARAVARRWVAVLLALVTAALLVWVSLQTREMKLGFTLIGGLPGDSAVQRAATAAQQGFAAGILSPTEIVVQDAGLTGRRQELVDLQASLAKQPHVAAVIGPEQAFSPPVSVGPIALPVLRSTFLAPNGRAARYVVVLNVNPLSSEGIVAVRQIRAAMLGLLSNVGLGSATVGFAGDTVLAEQTIDRTFDDLLRIAVAVLLIDLILLAVFLRALIAPIYLLAASVLALTATFGLAAYFFQSLLDWDGLTYYVPLSAAVLLVALGSDYNIFLVGVIWEEGRRHPLPQAIQQALPRATAPISVAALVLALSFALLALVPVDAFRELAFLLFAGVLLDSFVVRSILVPALVRSVGEVSLWPGRLPQARGERVTGSSE